METGATGALFALSKPGKAGAAAASARSSLRVIPVILAALLPSNLAAGLQNRQSRESRGNQESQQGPLATQFHHPVQSQKKEPQRDARVPDGVKARFRHAYISVLPPLVPIADERRAIAEIAPEAAGSVVCWA